MAITLYSEEQILEQVLAYFRIVFPNQDLSTESFLGLTARSVAQSLLLIQAAVQRADWDGTPAYQQDADGTRRTRTSTEALDQWAYVFGLQSDVEGVYGRRGAIASSGGRGLPTGVLGTVFPDGAQLNDSTGQVIVQLNGPFTVTSPVSPDAFFSAVTKGSASNLPIGSVLTWVSPPSGANPTMTLTVALSNGKERETDTELLDRLLFRIQNPPKGGVAADYRSWAENSRDSNGASLNIARAYIFPLRQGLGTVDVMPLYRASGTGRDPGGTVATNVLIYINKLRPVTAKVYTIRPTMVPLKIRTLIIPSATRYNFDWVDATGGYLITAFAGNLLRVAGGIPNLESAVDNGIKPRIQVINTSTGATPQPYQRRVLSYNKITVPGSTIYTLESAISPVPAIGDTFYAGGPVVDPIANSVLQYVDNLGPSRQSGYADEFDPWEYKVSIARLADVILETRDTDGSRFVNNIPNLATPPNNGIQISVSGAAYTANDYEPKDRLVACELGYLSPGGIAILRYQ